MTTDSPDSGFDRLPRFDARDFEPPAWASGSQFAWKKNGESSKSGSNGLAPPSPDGKVRFDNHASRQAEEYRESADHRDQEEEEEGSDDEFVDAQEEADLRDEEPSFTTDELKALLDKGNALKSKGNARFTSSPPCCEEAIERYKEALEFLPAIPRGSPTTPPLVSPGTSGVAEVTDEEAAGIISEAQRRGSEPSDEGERRKAEEEIRECTKACWGNIGACHVALTNDAEAVSACTKALEIDPYYVKALQRRAAANEHYTALLKLLPPQSPLIVLAREALNSLPERITRQQEQEKDEMLGKLKELGNGLLGKFGLNTDMFKFDQQEGGGYNLRFER